MELFHHSWPGVAWIDFLAAGGTSFLLIFAAEIGDKTQLVCMVLAARHRALPVFVGSSAAFALLNSLAVVFGVVIANLIPETLVFGAVALLFLAFGIQTLRFREKEKECRVKQSSRNIVLTSFLLIFVAEFGDKTQLAVVGLSSAGIPAAVWIGSTAALIVSAALGIWAGRTVLQRIPVVLLHRISGGLFIVLALFAAYKAFQAL